MVALGYETILLNILYLFLEKKIYLSFATRHEL